mgnify:CR=1 FL=1
MDRKGISLAMASFFMWGTFPLYWVNTIELPAFEVLSHRGFWIVPVLIAVLFLRRLWPKVRQACALVNLRWLMVSAVLIAINWGVYVWAVAEQAVTEAALGYYLTPLLNVAMGMLIFGERLSRLKYLALGLAAIGVLSVAWLVGEWPWFGLAVGFSFAAYSSARKMVNVESIVGLSVESFLLFPIWALYLWFYGDIKWVTTEPTAAWLILGGAVTAIPLITHVAAARRIPLSLLGMLFFTVPTLQMLSGVLVLNEPFDQDRAIAFGFIWAAVAIFLFDEYRRSQASKIGFDQPADQPRQST